MAGPQRRKEKQSSGVMRKNHTHITIEESEPLKCESAYALATQVFFFFSFFKETNGRRAIDSVSIILVFTVPIRVCFLLFHILFMLLLLLFSLFTAFIY